MPEPITNVAKNTWWWREQDKAVYYICEVGFGLIWITKLYARVVSKVNEQDFINAVNQGKIKKLDEHGNIQI